MLKLIEKKKKDDIIKYCLERFGVRQENLERYDWYEGSKNRIFIGPEKVKRINPESLGSVSYTHLTLPTKRIV